MPMTYRSALRLIKENGGVFVRHGGRHDEFQMPWGVKILVPRHSGDFSRGVEGDIKRKVTGRDC